MPTGWFPDAPADREVLEGVLSMGASLGAHADELIAFADAQNRIRTSSGAFLDLLAFDYFGARFRRRPDELDASFRARIVGEILRERATRRAIEIVVSDLTGRTPRIFEGWRPLDTGAYGVARSGYGVAGRYGSLAMPAQGLVDVFRAPVAGIPNHPGYGSPWFGYGARGGYAALSDVVGPVTDTELYAAVASVVPAGVIAWTRITN
jgi:hypothetical protein